MAFKLGFILFFIFIICSTKADVSGYFWHISDFHLDLEYSVKGDVNSLCHINKTAPTQNHPSKYGNYLCDSPRVLVESAIDRMHMLDNAPDFIIWTGDNTPHFDCDWAKVFEILKTITTYLRKTFNKDIPIIPVIGNHDTYPANEIPSNNQSLYNDYLTKGGWDQLFVPKETFLKGGYFSMDVNPKLRVLSLNTILWYVPNNFTKDESDPSGQLEWMEKQLKEAKNNGTKVYLIGHVPAGQDDFAANRYLPKVYSRYVSIIKTYQQQIAGQFFGHLHVDSFRIFLDHHGNSFGSMLLASSVTPWHTPSFPSSIPINPSIRRMIYNTTSFVPIDFQQYYLNISLQNEGLAKWDLLYQFSQEFNTSDLSDSSLLFAFKQLVERKSKLDTYLNHMTAGVPQKDAQNPAFRVKKLCELVNLEKADFDKCRQTCNTQKCVKPKDYFPSENTKPSSPLTVIQIIFIVLVTIGLISLICFLGYKKVKKIQQQRNYEYARF